MRRIFFLAAACALLAAGFVLVPRIQDKWERSTEIADREHVILPPITSTSSSVSSAVASAGKSSSLPVASSVSSKNIAGAVNLDVPFTSQAPLANWDELHGEACEEASVLMAIRYFEGRKFASPDDADAAIIKLVQDNEDLGFTIDDTAAQVVTLIESQDAPIEAELLKNPSVDDIKEVLNEGGLVIVPAAGRQLKNPYFQTPGPIYHMLVVRGYTDDGYVITNDPGTKRGEQFVYKWETLMNAIHDWNGGDVENGAKVVVVVRGT